MLGAWLHGILHLQEGDLEDAENWYDRAARHFRSRGTLAEEIAAFEAALAAHLTQLAQAAPAAAPAASTPPDPEDSEERP